LDFQDLIPKETVSYGYLLVQRKYTGVRYVLLASLNDMQKTWKRMTISLQVRDLIYGIQPK
jgi:hypothetical protein